MLKKPNLQIYVMFLTLSLIVGRLTLILKLTIQDWFFWTQISHVALGSETIFKPPITKGW